MRTFEIEASAPPTVPLIASSEIILATDGSSPRTRKIHSSAYISTNGIFGVVAARFRYDRCWPRCTFSTELRAAYYGLRRLRDTDASITILTDSMDTATWIAGWREGDAKLPAWYDTERTGGKEPTLALLRDMVRERASEVSVEHVKAHSGNIFNEAADHLARIGSRYLMDECDYPEAREWCQRRAEAFFLAYAESGMSNEVTLND